VPTGTPLYQYQHPKAIAPLPGVLRFDFEGVELKTLGLKPGRRHEDMALPDLPQLVEAHGGLPPSRRVLFYDCQVNERGLRGEQVYAYRKPPGAYRVGVIGTGVTFGEGVQDDETFCALLERQLNQDPPAEARFEVVNFGIPCMTTDYARNAFLKHERDYEVDFWVFSVGVNDALPMFERPLEQYRTDVAALVKAVRGADAKAVVLVEPVNSFYPWLQRYGAYKRALLEQVAAQLDVIDMAAILDCHEREQGLRLEIDGGLQQVVQYRDGQPRTLLQVEYLAGQDEQFIAPSIYEYLDGHLVWMKTFITDVHLNPFGHQVVAETLHAHLGAHLRGEPAPAFPVEGCGVE